MPQTDESVALHLLGLVRFATGPGSEVTLTERGNDFDNAANVFKNRELATEILRDGYLELAATQALMQGLHGRGPVGVDGALHLLVRHKLAFPDEATRLRRFLQVLNDLDIVTYSTKHQTVRIVATMPVQEEPGEPKPLVRVVEKDRPYSNVRHMRDTLRECKSYIWWVDPNFERRGLDLLVDVADTTRISEIRILSGGRPDRRDVQEFKRFKEEMNTLGITAEWRMIAQPDVEWHDRYIVTRGKSWNVPPIGAVFKGKHSQINEAPPPPYETWWNEGTSVEDIY